ncbi:hypothetical protein QBC40DRAFT_331679 [Triangularia verruculosa]|uniref:BTB domain-containing protein n=1 Tax=Triangularia verruculosa TaxID=2587418 RepID=A0AAN6XDW2_9PEZI|nr:hypothetical protein QBC40DRAFT_331679 [Triangularia verruculosa]
MAPTSPMRGAPRGRGGVSRRSRGMSSRDGGLVSGRGGRGNLAVTSVAAARRPSVSVPAPSASDQSSPELMTGPTRRRAPKAPEPTGKPWSVSSMTYRHDAQALKMLQTGEYSDALVLADGREWKVHRATLSSRSRWFERVFKSQQDEGLNEINLYPQTAEHVDLLLQTLYSNRLPDQYLDIHGASSTFCHYVKIFNLADTFEVDTMLNDTLTLLGQLADRYLEEICTFDKSLSGREGVVEPKATFPFTNLAVAVLEAFGGERADKRAQCLLANFLHAGREVLLENAEMKAIVERNDQVAAALWRASQGRNLANWLPNSEVIGHRLRAFDHSIKTQHPDRCELCDEIFDNDKRKRIMYDPYKVHLRPAGYCGHCVDKYKDDPECLFRKTGKTDKQLDDLIIIKPEPEAQVEGEGAALGIMPAIEGLGLRGPTMSTPATSDRRSTTPVRFVAPLLSDEELMPPPPLPPGRMEGSERGFGDGGRRWAYLYGR